MTRIVLYLLYRICGWFQIFNIFYFANRAQTINISYHNIIPDNLFDSSIHLGVSHPASIFEKQLIHIARRFRIRVDDPDKPGGCRITFDDGYINQKEIGASILEKHGFRGVFFVPFEPLENGNTLAIDEIMNWFSYAPSGRYQVGKLQFELLEDQRLNCFQNVVHYLRNNPDQWHIVVEQLNQAFSYSKLNIDPELMRLRFTPFSRQDVEEMRSGGHRIGCHGWDHRPMSTLAPQEVSDELARCREKLRAYCNSEEFSYPFGGEAEVTPEIATACANAGFSHAFMNIEKVPRQFTDVRKHAIPRISLPVTDSVSILDAKLSGFERWIKNLLGK